jgi:hypothetical protein
LVIFTVATNKISITFDIWTVGKHGLSYSCVTAHYIDHDWILQKKSIKFSNHGLSVHRTNYLENKIFLISFDNTSNNIKSIDNFTLALNPIMDGRKFHKKYACHILNLTFKASLKIIAINNLIYKFKDGIHHIYSNNIKK